MMLQNTAAQGLQIPSSYISLQTNFRSLWKGNRPRTSFPSTLDNINRETCRHTSMFPVGFKRTIRLRNGYGFCTTSGSIVLFGR